MSENTDPNPFADAAPGDGTHAPAPDEQAAHAETSAQPEGASNPRIAELEAEVSAMRDKWMRAEAEMQNVRTRAKREVEDARQYAVQKFAKDVVEAAENLKRAVASLPQPTEGEDSILTSMREGIESTERSFIGILERNGIKAEDAKGKPFDANLHQAMAEQHSDEHPQGTVMEAWTPAWTLHGRLLRPAMVVVSKGPAQAG
ncbi:MULTISPECIES: nucleotide exchange factor GrpE [Komagataeibacter]|uniref:nucleotide exchange factor GrpE n=1 Tax=Komagataeibacter TaxID=1434011 RepID=UPI000C83AF00|nr:nucleotide exchange factor GrpE [Komagataeibacter saccharivorans]PYD51780.1 nucleotide exchange factor GrpE [Komagataeibacter saccharivorans]QBL94177.1 Protein GrpE [Komagataeibacter saccharivorans]GBQ35485.1 heat shock protein GrpE [Komagataeibacter saccharivorans NRIC 0614]